MRYIIRLLLALSVVLFVCSCKIQDVPGPYAVAKSKKTVTLPTAENNNKSNIKVDVVQEDAVAEVVPVSENHTIVSKDEFVEEPSLVKEEEIIKDEEPKDEPMKGDEVASPAPIIKDTIIPVVDSQPKQIVSEEVKEVTRSEKFDVVEGQGSVQLKNYHVVIGSFSKKENAEKLKNSMMPQYTPIIVVNEKGMFRVLLTSCDEYIQAKSVIATIIDKFPDAWVLVQKK
ncbi:MAG: SPOR domain-containing protein [Bacteroidales bacterium]|nr:SPOR domain-containing protein [Bacteroidales bacterium]MDD5975039.1 SPOR domain-containing protein [Bacteroidales bacterium]MDY5193558.1 SPOR domain-containing protein [Candidatus Aphodosoma sp.]